MASLDFIYDITDKLNEDKIDYLVVAIRHQSDEDALADIFYNLTDDRTPEVLCETLDKFINDISGRYIDDDEDSDDDDSVVD